MSALQGGEIVAVAVEEAVSKLKLVAPDNELVRFAKDVGTCFGD